MRDLEAATANGNEAARVALDVYVGSIRHWLGGGVVELGGLDAIAFTGGIGENSPATRAAVVAGLNDLNIEIDNAVNHSDTAGERRIESTRSRVAIWVIPTNEELIVARQTRDFLALAS
jgi:acetate kinase